MQYHVFEQGDDLVLLAGSPLKEVTRLPKGDYGEIAEALNEWAHHQNGEPEPAKEEAGEEEPEPDFLERAVAAARAADAVRKSDGRPRHTRYKPGAREWPPFPQDRQTIASQKAKERNLDAKYLAPLAGVSNSFARHFLRGRQCGIDYGLAMEKAIDQAAAE
jgi:hypothetical protein